MAENNLNLAKHDDVVGFARRVGGDVGSLDNLDTVTKEDIVAAINSMVSRVEWLEYGPRSLSLRGEQGVWLDPSDLSTMFQDPVGTELVTKDGDPVGLILDKSQGMELGENLTPIIDFNDESRWTKGHHTNEISEDGKTVTTINTAGGIRLIGLDNGWYKLSVEAFSNKTTFGVRDGYGGKIFARINGEFKQTLIVFISNNELAFRNGYGGTSITIHNMQLQKLKGNHAIQETAAARPVYRTDGELHWLEFDGVDDTLSVQLPSGTYTEVKASREVVTHEHPVTINDSYTLGDLTQTRQDISGLVLVDKQLPQDKIDNVTNFMEVKAGLTL